MQYKSARPCFNIFSKIFLNTVASFALTTLAPQFASATLTPTAISKVPASFGTILNNSNANAFYYPVFITPGSVNGLTSSPTGVAQIGVVDPVFSFIDLGQSPDPAGSMQTQAGVIIFNILATTAVTGQAVLTATMTNGSSNVFVPILGWGQNNVMTGCEGSSGCLAQGGAALRTGNKFYYGVFYNPNQTFQIAISPTAFCESLDITSQTNTYCSGGFFTAGGAGGAVQTMQFNFTVFPSSVLPAGPTIVNTTAVPSGQTDTQPVTLDFVALNPQPVTTAVPTPTPSPSPTLNCVLTEGVYAPSPGGFTLQQPQNFTLQNDPTSTLSQLIVVAAPTPGPVKATVGSYTTNNTITEDVNGVTVSGFLDSGELASTNQYFGNFKNSDQNGAFYYDVAFLAEDPAGYIIDDGGVGTGSGGCTFPGVFSTSLVNGFLTQSKCFIATAAFRDLNSTPLILLRAFRDQFLEQFSLGRSFVHWYYAWSPHAAEWLIDHPVFRFPVLLALIPLQIFAWLVLHPFTLFAFLMMGAALITWASLFRRATE